MGLSLEKMHGWWRVMLIYLSGVLAGSLIGTVAYPNNLAYGASAGGYALITAQLSNALFNWMVLTFSVKEVLVYILFANHYLTVTVLGMCISDR